MTLNRTLIGMLTPSSNTVLEPYMSAILHDLLPKVSAHYQRFTVTQISMDDNALAQFTNSTLLDAAKILSDAKMDVIAWAGTAASWRGFDIDTRLCAEITAVTRAPATTSVLALNEILDRTQVQRLGLVTPYLDEVQSQIMANYRSAGHVVTAERHFGMRDNFSFSQFSEDQIEVAIRQVVAEGVDAVVVLCTNLRGAPLVDRLERELDVPIYDSVSATVWKAMRMTGLDLSRIKGWGRLFDREV
jgi:maleate isomerase